MAAHPVGLSVVFADDVADGLGAAARAVVAIGAGRGVEDRLAELGALDGVVAAGPFGVGYGGQQQAGVGVGGASMTASASPPSTSSPANMTIVVSAR